MYRAVFHGLSHGLAGAGFFFVRNPGPQHLRARCAAGDEEAAAVFAGENAEILHNNNWQDVEKNL